MHISYIIYKYVLRKVARKKINGKECETKCNEMRAKFEIIICLSLICLRQFFSYIN